MAIVNQYKFLGNTLTTDVEQTLLTPAIASSGSVETVIIKSFRVTNSTGNTPTITITNGSTKIVDTQTLAANTSVEILTLPLVVESGVALKVKMSSSDSTDIAVSYLNISQEVTDIMDTIKHNGKDIPVLNAKVTTTIKHKETGVIYKDDEEWKRTWN